MEKDTLLDIFNELLDEWYWAEDCCINDRSSNISKDQDELENRKKSFKKRFLDVLE